MNFVSHFLIMLANTTNRQWTLQLLVHSAIACQLRSLLRACGPLITAQVGYGSTVHKQCFATVFETD
jgi:hypothetical protein